MIYVQLPSNSEPPDISSFSPFKAIVVIDEEVDQEWQNKISDWLVVSDCKYMMAWGLECSSWDDSVDWACIAQHEQAGFTKEQCVTTTWHKNETLNEVFFYAKHVANHEAFQLDNLLVIHISALNKESEFREIYKDA